LFVEYSAEVEIDARQAVELLTSDRAEMEGMGEVAYRRGEDLRARVGPGRLIAKEVVVSLGPAVMSRRGPVLPVRWRATGAEALFPSLEGELVLSDRDGSGTTLHLQATYRPPFGSVGDMMDRLLLARVAKATVEDWVERMAEWLNQAASADREHHLDHGSRPND
jgi:hypothetical protein